jgi:phosphatidylglycerophosphatase C
VTSTETSTLAVFDLDGTLLTSDSFGPFLRTFARSYGLRPAMLLIAPVCLVAYALQLISARTLKERLMAGILGGHPSKAIHEHAVRFCASWVAEHYRTNGIELLRHHQAARHRVILESASPNVYVPIIARALGISEVICTRVQCENDICTGRIIGPNCKGEDKVRLLKEYLGAEGLPPESYSYGDSISDLPLLRWVRHGFMLKQGAFSPILPERAAPAP